MNEVLNLDSIIVATSEQVSCPLGEESSILNLKNSSYYGLNAVGARVWTLLRTEHSIAEIRDVLLQEYDVDPDRCERDLLDLLTNMQNEGLIEMRKSRLPQS